MPLIIGRPLDKLARALLTIPPAPEVQSILRDETTFPVVNLREVMGQTPLGANANPTGVQAAGTILTDSGALPSDGFYDVAFGFYPITILTSAKRFHARILDETGLYYQEIVTAGVTAAANPATFTRIVLSLYIPKTTWRFQWSNAVDAMILGESVVVYVSAFLRYQ